MQSNIRAERCRRFLTIKQLAGKLGVSANAVQRWERGIEIPTTENLVKMSKLFSVPIEYLYANFFNSKNTRKSVHGDTEKPSVMAEGNETERK